jgi:fructose-1,6-bisphosphatase I
MENKRGDIMSARGTDLYTFILEEERKNPDVAGSLTPALTAITTAGKIIASNVRRAGLAGILGATDRVNIQGEEVQKLDLLSNELLVQYISDSGQFYALASEELDDALYPEKGKDGRYVIAFDPLDGSSNIDVNVSIGTIFSIHRKVSGTIEDFFQEGYKQVASGYIVYGSSTMLVYSAGNGVNGFTLDPSTGLFLLSHPDMKMPDKGKIYSINEANYLKWEEGLRKYVDSLKEQSSRARYIGSMVADVHRTLIKGGIFAYPADEKNPSGKLRLLYEASPMAFLIEQAGGRATTGKEDILRVKPESLHQRVPVFLGSRGNIEEVLSFLNG